MLKPVIITVEYYTVGNVSSDHCSTNYLSQQGDHWSSTGQLTEGSVRGTDGTISLIYTDKYMDVIEERVVICSRLSDT